MNCERFSVSHLAPQLGASDTPQGMCYAIHLALLNREFRESTRLARNDMVRSTFVHSYGFRTQGRIRARRAARTAMFARRRQD